MKTITRLYQLILFLYPSDFREEFGEEMATVFEEQLEVPSNGRLALIILLLREFGGLLAENVRQWLYLLQARPLLLAQAGGGVKVHNSRPRPWLFLFSFATILLLGVLYLYQTIGFGFGRPPRVHEIALGDLDGDGDLDAFLNIGSGGGEPYVRPDCLLFNDGSGGFRDSQQLLDRWPGRGVIAGDLSGNGLADIILDIDGGSLVLYMNYGDINRGDKYFQLVGSPPIGGFLSGTAPAPRGVMRMKPELGDLNGDGYLDVFSAGCCGREGSLRPEGGAHLLPYSLAWINDGRGRGGFISNGQTIGAMGSNAVALGDFNNDGYLDAFLANGRTLDASGHFTINTPNTVWFNDQEAQFQDSGQQLGNAESTAVAVGDVNGNGHLDAVVGNRGSDTIWLNDGQGNFSDSDQRLGSSLTEAVYLADLNGNGYLDLVVDGEETIRIWFNDGTGQFSQGQLINYGRYEAITLGDVTGDGFLDIFVAGVKAYQVWQGKGSGLFTVSSRANYR